MGIYLGINSTASIIQKMYVGINNKARKIKKAYVGIDGVARLFFNNQTTLVYDGTYNSTSLRRYGASLSSNSTSYILSGGKQSEYGTEYVQGATSISSDYTETSIDSSLTIENQCGTTFSNSAVFGCGSERGYARSSVVSYDEDLTYVSHTSSNTSGQGVSTSTTPNHLVFAGSGVYGYGSRVSAYDTDFVRTNLDALSVPGGYMSPATLKSGALFYGGVQELYSSIPALQHAYLFNDDLTRQDISDVPRYSYGIATASMGSAVVLAGGGTPNSTAATSDAYVLDSDLSKTTIGSLSIARKTCGGINLGGIALIIGGNTSSGNSKIAEYYDSDFVHTTELTVDNYSTFNDINGSGSIATVSNAALVYSGDGSTSMMKFYVK